MTRHPHDACMRFREEDKSKTLQKSRRAAKIGRKVQREKEAVEFDSWIGLPGGMSRRCQIDDDGRGNTENCKNPLADVPRGVYPRARVGLTRGSGVDGLVSRGWGRTPSVGGVEGADAEPSVENADDAREPAVRNFFVQNRKRKRQADAVGEGGEPGNPQR